MIPIYDREIKDGLKEAISNTTIAYLTPLNSSQSIEHKLNIAEIQSKAIAAGISNDRFGLYPLDSVLASIGWNGNDDVFSKEYSWNAKSTAIDKPVNFMHNESDIIGHMTASIVLDFDGKIVPNDTKLEDVPNEFDIITSSVLYTVWSSKELQDRIDNIIAEIPLGKWFVSMECVFNDFDYAVITPTGEKKTIARNNQTSFLTKYLRIYGGTGTYQGYKLGRQLKDFIFVGKGIVDNPANKRSLILTKAESFISKAHITNFNEKVSTMEEKDLLALNQKLDEINKTVSTIKVDTLETKVTTVYEKQIAELNSELASRKQTNEELAAKNDELSKALANKDAEINAVKVELNTVKRLAKATVKGLSTEEATKLVETWANATEEQFDNVLSLVKVEAKKTDATEVVETITQKAEANLVVPPVPSNDEVRSKAAEWFKSNFKTKGNK